LIEFVKCFDRQGRINSSLTIADSPAINPGITFKQMLDLMGQISSEGLDTKAGTTGEETSNDGISTKYGIVPGNNEGIVESDKQMQLPTEVTVDTKVKTVKTPVLVLPQKINGSNVQAAYQLADALTTVAQTEGTANLYSTAEAKNELSQHGSQKALQYPNVESGPTVKLVSPKPSFGDAEPLILFNQAETTGGKISNDGISTKSDIGPGNNEVIIESDKQMQLPSEVTVDTEAKTVKIPLIVLPQPIYKKNGSNVDTLTKALTLVEIPLATSKPNQNLVAIIDERGIKAIDGNLQDLLPKIRKMPQTQETGINKQQSETLQNAMSLPNYAARVDSTIAGGAIPISRPEVSQIITQLAEGVRGHIVKDGNGQTMVRLQLQPEHLGELTIRLTYKDGNISTQIQAATEHAKQIIENSLPQLRDTLASFQLNLQNVSVSVGGENNHRGQEWDRERWLKKQQGTKVSGAGTNSVDTVPGASAKILLSSTMNQLNYFV